MSRENSSENLYNEYHKEKVAAKQSESYGFVFLDKLLQEVKFTSFLDAGCGNAAVVRELLNRGYDAKGIDVSDYIINDVNRDLVENGVLHAGSLENLPFPDKSFDLVFSSDVLEHITVEKVQRVASELVRVSKDLLFLSISLRPSAQNNKFHITLRPRSWWEESFAKAGVIRDQELIDRFQLRKPCASVEEILRIGPARFIAEEMRWFFENPPYDFNGELEPWFFAFRLPKT
jgi:SAM-dependent methyltransferase